jgi:hypothetical protein
MGVKNEITLPNQALLYILECLLYLSVSTGTLTLYRINHKEIKLIGYCVVFIVMDFWLTFMPDYGGGVPHNWV